MNGRPEGPEGLGVALDYQKLDYQKWRRITQGALAEAERQKAALEATAALTRKQLVDKGAELRFLRRVLALAPPGGAPNGTAAAAPPSGRRGLKGLTAAERIAGHLEDVVRTRPDGELTWALAHQACPGTAQSTVADALRLLLSRGVLVKPQPGRYILGPPAPVAPVEAGLSEAPVARHRRVAESAQGGGGAAG